MIKFENTDVFNMNNALRGMRNPMNSWYKADTKICGEMEDCLGCPYENDELSCQRIEGGDIVEIGPNDLKLCQNLIKAGTEHSKFMRQIFVSVDITAPLYWWKEFDTYKVGTVANSCSTMHKIHAKEFTRDDFSTEHLVGGNVYFFDTIIKQLNDWRDVYLHADDVVSNTNKTLAQEYSMTGKDIWWQMIQLLPSSYNQKRTVTLNYEVIKSIYRQRKNHKLDEWSDGFIDWIKELPFAEELIMI